MKPPPLRSVLSIIGGVIIWQAVAGMGFIDPQRLPRPTQVIQDFVDISLHGYGGASLWRSLTVSTVRLFIGVSAATVIGVLIGYAAGVSRAVSGLIDPLFGAVRSIPPLGLLSLLIVWFGIGECSKIVMLALAAMAPIVLSTAHGLSSIRLERLQGARSLGLSGSSLFWRVTLPTALPDIMIGLRVGVGYAFGALVAAEMIGASSGLGWMVWNASQYGETGVVIVLIIVIGFVGLLVDVGLKVLRDHLVPWSGRA